MIRQVCSQCFKTVELPDTAAGQTVPCPKCDKPLSVAAAYTPGVAAGGGLAAAPLVPPTPTPRPGAKPPMTEPPAPPPGFKTEPPAPGAAAPPTTPAADPAAGYARGFALPFKAGWLDWVPAGCILLAFVLTFFPWAEMKLGGYTILNQSGWEAAFGGKGGSVPEKEARVESVKDGDKTVTGPTADTWTEFDKAITPKNGEQKATALQGNLMLIFYLLPLLLLAVVLFAAERVITDPAKFKLPTVVAGFLNKLWPWRLAVLGALAAVLLLLVWVSAMQGYGLQHSANAYAKGKYQKQLDDANLSDNEKRAVWVAFGQEQGKYPVTPTLWLRLVLVLHGVAVLAILARFWQATRGTKPPPRLAAQW